MSKGSVGIIQGRNNGSYDFNLGMRFLDQENKGVKPEWYQIMLKLRKHWDYSDILRFSKYVFKYWCGDKKQHGLTWYGTSKVFIVTISATKKQMMYNF